MSRRHRITKPKYPGDELKLRLEQSLEPGDELEVRVHGNEIRDINRNTNVDRISDNSGANSGRVAPMHRPAESDDIPAVDDGGTLEQSIGDAGKTPERTQGPTPIAGIAFDFTSGSIDAAAYESTVKRYPNRQPTDAGHRFAFVGGTLSVRNQYVAPLILNGRLSCAVTKQQLMLGGAGCKHTMFSPVHPVFEPHGNGSIPERVTFKTAMLVEPTGVEQVALRGFMQCWQIWSESGGHPVAQIYIANRRWVARLTLEDGVEAYSESTPVRDGVSRVEATYAAHPDNGVFQVRINDGLVFRHHGKTVKPGRGWMTIGCYSYNPGVGFSFDEIKVEAL